MVVQGSEGPGGILPPLVVIIFCTRIPFRPCNNRYSTIYSQDSPWHKIRLVCIHLVCRKLYCTSLVSTINLNGGCLCTSGTLAWHRWALEELGQSVTSAAEPIGMAWHDIAKGCHWNGKFADRRCIARNRHFASAPAYLL